MKYVTAFILKWVIIAAVLLVVYSAVYGADIGNVILMSVIFTAVSFLGDIFILPRVKNSTETILDLVLSFVLLWALGSWLTPEVPIITAAIISTVVIAVGEWFLHSYMKRNIFHQRSEGTSHA